MALSASIFRGVSGVFGDGSNPPAPTPDTAAQLYRSASLRLDYELRISRTALMAST
jgi:hypothetical protein